VSKIEHGTSGMRRRFTKHSIKTSICLRVSSFQNIDETVFYRKGQTKFQLSRASTHAHTHTDI